MQQPPEMKSSQVICVGAGKRKDGQWGVSFALIDSKFEDIFSCFCDDIIESSKDINKDNGADFIANRYAKWQDMLTKFKGDLLERSAIKGLVGELIFFKTYLVPLVGEELALDSWIGPAKADQDFVCPEIWYEIKSTVSGSESVKISSIEQLDTQKIGELVVIYLDETSPSDSEGISLNSIFESVHHSLSNEELKRKLKDLVLSLGYYPRSEYDKPVFKFTEMARFLVDNNFPCLRRNNLPDAIINTIYVLSLSSISNSAIGD
jgi:hypothetical protein